MKCKSIIISNGKRLSKNSEIRMMGISLFGENNPHMKGEVPFKVFEFPATKVLISSLDIIYLPYGRDILINNLKSISVKGRKKTILISGKQSR